MLCLIASIVISKLHSILLIDAICLARDCDKSYLVGKIIEKADAYAVAVGTLTGIRQKLEKEISGE